MGRTIIKLGGRPVEGSTANSNLPSLSTGGTAILILEDLWCSDSSVVDNKALEDYFSCIVKGGVSGNTDESSFFQRLCREDMPNPPESPIIFSEWKC